MLQRLKGILLIVLSCAMAGLFVGAIRSPRPTKPKFPEMERTYTDLVNWGFIDSNYTVKRLTKEKNGKFCTPYVQLLDVAKLSNDTLVVTTTGKGRDFKVGQLCDSNFYSSFETFKVDSKINMEFNTMVIQCVTLKETQIECVKAFVGRQKRGYDRRTWHALWKSDCHVGLGKTYKGQRQRKSFKDVITIYFSKDYKRLVIMRHGMSDFGLGYLRFIQSENLVNQEELQAESKKEE